MAHIFHNKACIYLSFPCLLIFVVGINSRNDISEAQHLNYGGFIQEHAFSNVHLPATNRKLLASPSTDDYDDDNGGGGTMDRIGTQCSKESIYVSQGQTSPLPNGIPTYTVQIQNICLSGSCSISDIHLSCGWFSSARLINPDVFRRISYDDCLVNNGNPIIPGQTISFQYANTFAYPMSVSSISCY